MDDGTIKNKFSEENIKVFEKLIQIINAYAEKKVND